MMLCPLRQADGSSEPSDADDGADAWEHQGYHWHDSLQQPTTESRSTSIGEGYQSLSHRIFSEESIANLSCRPRVINPEHSSWLLSWDFIVALAVSVVAMVTPYEAAFLQPRFDAHFILDRGLDFILVADMVMQLFIGYPDYKYRQGRMVTAKGAVAWNYFTGWFIVDLIGVFPIDLVLIRAKQEPGWNLAIRTWWSFRILRLVRMFLLARLKRILQRWDSQFGLSYAKLTLCKFACIVILVCHWMACIWGSIAVHLSDGSTATWLSELHGGGYLEAKDLEEDYIFVYGMSVYWAIITLTSIGYGDIVPQNAVEYLVATVCSAVMASIWAYVIGSVCGIVSTLDPHEVSFKRTMDDLNWMMTDVNMPSHMAQRFRKYFVEAKEMNKQRIENTVIDQMSPQLQGECAMFLHQKWIEKVWYLKDMPSEVVVWAARHLSLMVYAPNEEVLPERTLFIVRHGVAAQGGRILVGGDIWGQDMLLSNEHIRDKQQVHALSYLHVLKLHVTDLSDIVLVFPVARHHLRAAQVKISFTRGLRILARELRLLGQAGLHWWEVPDESRPFLYFQILHGHYDREEWLAKKDLDTPESDANEHHLNFHTHLHHPHDTHGHLNGRSATKDVLDGIMSVGFTKSTSSGALGAGGPSARRAGTQDVIRNLSSGLTPHPTSKRNSQRDSRRGSGGSLGSHDGQAHDLAPLAKQIESLERNVAMLAEKVDMMSGDVLGAASDGLHMGASSEAGRVWSRGAGPVQPAGHTHAEDLMRKRYVPSAAASSAEVDFGSMAGFGNVFSKATTATTKSIGFVSSGVAGAVSSSSMGAKKLATKGGANLTSGFRNLAGSAASGISALASNVNASLGPSQRPATPPNQA